MTASTAHPLDLEPSLVAPRTYTTRRNYTRIDVANVLIVLIGLLYLLPAHLIVPNLTYAGRPALMVALVLWCFWLLSRLNPRLTMTGPQPLRWAAFFYLISLAASYLAGLQRGLTTLEANGQDFSVITAFEFFGVVLMTADGVPNWSRLKDILRLYVWFAAFMATVGLMQALADFDPTQYMILPGLQLKGDLAGFEERGTGGLYRIAGTAIHYIEFATVLAMALPFAIHFARFSPTKRQRRIYTAISLLIAAVVPMAISRTGILALITVLVVMVPVWSWRFRYNLLCIVGIMTLASAALRPGLIGTLRSYMFATSSDDPSIQGRTDDYVFVERWFSQRPLLGRGPGTLIPVLYRVLDNQWLGQLVTYGLVGVIALLTLHITCITLARLGYKRSPREEERHLCVALIAVQVIAILVAFTFDSLGFSTFAITLAFMMGCCGAVWRFTHPARAVRTSTVRRF